MQHIPELSGPEQPPASGGAPKQLVIFLHGLGANGADLIGLAPELEDILPDAQFVSPNAPFPCDMAPFGYQWFSLRQVDPAYLIAGAQRAAPVLDRFITQQLERFGLDESKLAVIGFSQGTMMALYTLPRRKKACAGIVGFSGALIGELLLKQDAQSRPPACLIHGDADPVVPFAALAHAEGVLAECGITVEAHARPGLAHGIDPEGLEIAREFLRKHVK